jgi:hypothetical protein
MKFLFLLLTLSSFVVSCNQSSESKSCTYNNSAVDCSALESSSNQSEVKPKEDRSQFPETMIVKGSAPIIKMDGLFEIAKDQHFVTNFQNGTSSYQCKLDFVKGMQLNYEASEEGVVFSDERSGQKLELIRVKGTAVDPTNYFAGTFEEYQMIGGRELKVSTVVLTRTSIAMETICYPRLDY